KPKQEQQAQVESAALGVAFPPGLENMFNFDPSKFEISLPQKPKSPAASEHFNPFTADFSMVKKVVAELRKKHPKLKVNAAPRKDNRKYRESVEDALHSLDPDLVAVAYDAVKNREFMKKSQPKPKPSTMAAQHEFDGDGDGDGEAHNFRGLYNDEIEKIMSKFK